MACCGRETYGQFCCNCGRPFRDESLAGLLHWLRKQYRRHATQVEKWSALIHSPQEQHRQPPKAIKKWQGRIDTAAGKVGLFAAWIKAIEVRLQAYE